MKIPIITSFLALTPAAAFAESGKVTQIWADPNETQVVLDSGNSCGGTFNTLIKSDPNCPDLFALTLMAKTSGATVTFFTKCKVDRAIISHGWVQ